MTETWIAPEAKIGRNVTVGLGTRIYPRVEIGDNTTIDDCCVIGRPAGGSFAGCLLSIGAGSVIRSHTVLYEGSRLGERFEVGHHSLIREGTRAGTNLKVGSFSDIEGDCEIGDYCRFHGYVHIGRGSQIGHFVWLYSITTLTNDALPPSDLAMPVRIEDGVVVCVGALMYPGAVIRRGAFISAGAHVRGEVPAGAVISGLDGRIVSHVTLLAHLESGTRHPWMRHFGHYYPPEAQSRIAALLDQILADRAALQL